MPRALVGSRNAMAPPGRARGGGVDAARRGADALRLARADGTYTRLLARIAKVDVLVLDDVAIGPLTKEARRDLLEILEDATTSARRSSRTRSNTIAGTTSSLTRPQTEPSLSPPTRPTVILQWQLHLEWSPA